MESLNSASYRITLGEKGSTLYISKSVVRAVGVPNYISLRVNESNDSLIITPCDEKQVLSFKVPEHLFNNQNVKMRIYSQRFVSEMMAANGLDVQITCSFYGRYIPGQNCVVFPIGLGSMERAQ